MRFVSASLLGELMEFFAPQIDTAEVGIVDPLEVRKGSKVDPVIFCINTDYPFHRKRSLG